ncbi:MAG: AAA family ATPase [Anaerolineae bacterium]|nr:AAA family ATPase [Anaerolineae bacterium]
MTQESGSLYDLAARLGIETPQPVVSSSKREYTGLDDYATAHGVTGEVLRAAKWHEVMKDNRLALEFPTKTGPRWRFLDGQKPFYKSPPGYNRCWFGLNAAFLKRIADGQPLVICNGEASVVVAQHYGLAALAVTGGEKQIPPPLFDELAQGLGELSPPVLIAMDCDSTGRRAGRQVAGQFRERGYDVRAVNLGLSLGADLADFCALHRDQAGDLLAACDSLDWLELESRPWIIIPARDLAKLPPITWLIEGVIPERGLTVIYGPSGVGKSFLALDYALQIAQASTVVYVAAEGQSGYRQRVAAWCKHNQKAEGHLYLCLGSPNLMDAADLDQFVSEIVAFSPAMVIVDTLAMAMIGGDENSARDMGLTIRACKAISREAGCAVVLVYHTNKYGVVERGSSALRGAADSMVRVTGDDDVIVIESAKSKDAAPFAPQYRKLLPVHNEDGTESRVLVPAERIVQTQDDPLTMNQRKVLESLALEAFETGATVSDLTDTSDLGRGSVIRVLSRLVELGCASKDSSNYPNTYEITELGRTKITPVDSVDSVDSVGAKSDSVADPVDSASQPSQPHSLFSKPTAYDPDSYYEQGM